MVDRRSGIKVGRQVKAEVKEETDADLDIDIATLEAALVDHEVTDRTTGAAADVKTEGTAGPHAKTDVTIDVPVSEQESSHGVVESQWMTEQDIEYDNDDTAETDEDNTRDWAHIPWFQPPPAPVWPPRVVQPPPPVVLASQTLMPPPPAPTGLTRSPGQPSMPPPVDLWMRKPPPAKASSSRHEETFEDIPIPKRHSQPVQPIVLDLG